ncbi:MAG: ATP-binding cassette domain-containing protein [Holdemania massiliensis]
MSTSRSKLTDRGFGWGNRSGQEYRGQSACCFYQPLAGQVLIDGKDVRERSLGWLHSNLGYVLQSPHLFSGTVKDNIRYGKLDASDEQIEAAAKMVDAHEFILRLEKG